MIDGVRKVTHIAPPDENGLIIGEKVVQDGVIAIPMAPKEIGLCAGVTNAKYAATTEVYPDSMKLKNSIYEEKGEDYVINPYELESVCNDAQQATILSGLAYVMEKEGLYSEAELKQGVFRGGVWQNQSPVRVDLDTYGTCDEPKVFD